MGEVEMKDPKRIEKIMELIIKIWEENPNLRLNQLIGNCFEAKDLYYVDDELLEKALREKYLK